MLGLQFCSWCSHRAWTEPLPEGLDSTFDTQTVDVEVNKYENRLLQSAESVSVQILSHPGQSAVWWELDFPEVLEDFLLLE